MLKGTLQIEPELGVKHADAKPKHLITSRSKVAKDMKLGTVGLHVDHGVEGDVFFEAAEDNINHSNGRRGNLISSPSDDSLDNEAMS